MMSLHGDHVARRSRILVLALGALLGGGSPRAPAGEAPPERILLLASGEAAASAVSVAPLAVREGRVLQRQPAGAFGGGVYLAAWCDGSRRIDRPSADIRCARIDARTGRPLDPEGIAVCAAPDLQEWPAAASGGESFLVVWQDFRSGASFDVRAARVTPAGEVLDRESIAVATGPFNECRPAVAFAGGHHVIVWMDARRYPTYGIYAARVSTAGEVLDPEGLALDVEDAGAIRAVKPPGDEWLGDRHYWWQRLSSRSTPSIASSGDHCLVAYSKEYPFAESGRPAPTALLLNAADGRIERKPVRLPSGAHDTIAACAAQEGWTVILMDHAPGWDLSPRLAAVRLDGELETTDAFAKPSSGEPEGLPVLDLARALMPEGTASLNPGKGALSFWRPAAAWDGSEVVAATDFGWRSRREANAITYAIVTAHLAQGAERFAGDACRVAALTERADQAVANPALVAGPPGETLLLYERDASIDRHSIEALILREPARDESGR